MNLWLTSCSLHLSQQHLPVKGDDFPLRTCPSGGRKLADSGTLCDLLLQLSLGSVLPSSILFFNQKKIKTFSSQEAPYTFINGACQLADGHPRYPIPVRSGRVSTMWRCHYSFWLKGDQPSSPLMFCFFVPYFKFGGPQQN